MQLNIGEDLLSNKIKIRLMPSRREKWGGARICASSIESLFKAHVMIRTFMHMCVFQTNLERLKERKISFSSDPIRINSIVQKGAAGILQFLEFLFFIKVESKVRSNENNQRYTT